MTNDEVIVFRQFNFIKTEGVRFKNVFHATFNDPNMPE